MADVRSSAPDYTSMLESRNSNQRSRARTLKETSAIPLDMSKDKAQSNQSCPKAMATQSEPITQSRTESKNAVSSSKVTGEAATDLAQNSSKKRKKRRVADYNWNKHLLNSKIQKMKLDSEPSNAVLAASNVTLLPNTMANVTYPITKSNPFDSRKMSADRPGSSSEPKTAASEIVKHPRVISFKAEKISSEPKTTKEKVNFTATKRDDNSANCVAIDCEMVGVEVDGREQNALARVSVVDYNLRVLLDTYVRPFGKIINYRTAVSGIEPHHIARGKPIDAVIREVAAILKNKIVIGHELKSDFEVLSLKPRYFAIRDTARWAKFRVLSGNNTTPSLRALSALLLNKYIQVREHDSVEDARAAMLLYKKYQCEWEAACAAMRKAQRNKRKVQPKSSNCF